jgi:cysteinyl-tRNA synthetase
VLRLHDTATGTKAPVELPEQGAPLGLYVCGPTVYGAPHIGHGRLSLVYDVLRRYIESTGQAVRHVSNVTDIDDKIIALATDEGRPVSEVAAHYEEAWWSAMDSLGALRPHDVPHATDYIDQMVALIEELARKEVAYEAPGGVYFEVTRIEGYGLLAHQSLESLRAGARVELSEGKRTLFDFALWKSAKPGEPQWPSPFGPGRPGWHTECVAMAFELLGEGFSLHGGGEDLKFPHHENERAQAVALGRPFARGWTHEGMVVAKGEKMSKSIGNIESLAQLVGEHDPRAYRLVVLQSHYRAPLEVHESRILAAERTLNGIDSLARRLAEAASARAEPSQAGPPEAAQRLVSSFRAHMDDDLGTPEAMATLFDGLTEANGALEGREVELGDELGRAVLSCFAAVGLRPAGAAQVSREALELAVMRDAARAARDYDAADRLRDEIVALGYRVEDTPTGTRVFG